MSSRPKCERKPAPAEVRTPGVSEGGPPLAKRLPILTFYSCILATILGISLAARTTDSPTDALKDSDCGGAVEYSATVTVQAVALNLPAGCKITVSNTGTIYDQITVVEPGFATARFNLPKSPVEKPKLWWLVIGKAADGSWFATLKSQ